MRARWKTVFVWIAAAVALLAIAGSLWLLCWGQVNGSPQPLQEVLQRVSYLSIGVALSLIGAFLALKRGDNLVSWITLGAGLSLSLAAFVEQYSHLAVTQAVWPAAIPALWLAQWVWMLPYVSLVMLLLYYPTGRLLSPRWRWVLRFSLLAYLSLAIIVAFSATLDPGEAGIGTVIANPIGFLPTPNESTLIIFIGVMLSTVAVALLGLGLRFYRARGIEREQMKWLLFAGAIFVVTMIPEFLNLPWVGVISNVVSLGIPLAIAVAILRYNLFEIDVIIRRTTAYAIITALLALIYFGSVVLLQRLLSPLTGESTPAVVLSTLLIAALFLPVRRRVQDAIDRRFNRTRYDAQRTLEAFAATVRNETDLDALTAELLRVIQETMQPESLSFWLKPIERPVSSEKTDQF
jgi:hypothetical protein